MLGEKRLCKIHQIGNDFVVPVRPEGGELKAVAGLFGFVPSLALLFDVAAAGGVGIILRVGAVGDDENLDIFKQAACCPEAVALVALDLVERLADGHTAPLELDMYQRQTIDEDGHVETVVLLSKGEVDSKKIRVEFSLEDMDMSEFQDGATYTQIKDYVLEHSGLKVSNLYISQIKRKCGIEVGKNYNLPKSEDSRQPQCPPEKEKAIREAFKYFGMI